MLEQEVEQEHQARSHTQARREAVMAVLPDDPDTLRARLERTNQSASLARQAVAQARQTARRAAREAAAPDMTGHHGPRADE